MTILEKVGDIESAAYTAVLNNLGLIYAEKRDFARAEEHYRRALALGEMLEGPEGYHISLYLQNLSSIARERKEYATALEYATRALSIRQSLRRSRARRRRPAPEQSRDRLSRDW